MCDLLLSDIRKAAEEGYDTVMYDNIYPLFFDKHMKMIISTTPDLSQLKSHGFYVTKNSVSWRNIPGYTRTGEAEKMYNIFKTTSLLK